MHNSSTNREGVCNAASAARNFLESYVRVKTATRGQKLAVTIVLLFCGRGADDDDFGGDARGAGQFDYTAPRNPPKRRHARGRCAFQTAPHSRSSDRSSAVVAPPPQRRGPGEAARHGGARRARRPASRPTRSATTGVITVVHRLSGWKLLAWLASTPSPVVEVEDLPFASDVHTNIVAGFVSEDGRTVFARLGQAEAEAGIAAPFGPVLSDGVDDAPDITLVRRDGQRYKARFIGLDGSTGLSLLEAVTPVIPPAAHVGAQRMSVGQRVRLYAPEPVSPPPAASPGPRE